MMEIGVVIHHGSMPLKARLLIEDFIKAGFARICFATSTLSQGVNMPFDLVWVDNFHNLPVLTLKNLIGRSGRTTLNKNSFDYGYTIVNSKNVDTFSRRYKETFSISDSSSLDASDDDVHEDIKDVVEALRDDSFDDELHVTKAQIERLQNADLGRSIGYVLDKLLVDGVPITGNAYYGIGSGVRARIKTSLKEIFVEHLRRKELTKAEASVLSAAIPIMLWHIQGRSFSEIVSLRYSFLSERDKQRTIMANVKRNNLSLAEAVQQIKKIKVRYSQYPSSLPDSSLLQRSAYQAIPVSELDYDSVVYDTYDYLDKVISQSLADPICAALDVYYRSSSDERTLVLKNYVRYGTNDPIVLVNNTGHI